MTLHVKQKLKALGFLQPFKESADWVLHLNFGMIKTCAHLCSVSLKVTQPNQSAIFSIRKSTSHDNTHHHPCRLQEMLTGEKASNSKASKLKTKID